MLKFKEFTIKRPITQIEIESGADAIYTLCQLEKYFGYREIEILKDLKTVEINHDVPSGYKILRFYDSNGNGFEGGKTPNGYSITC
jgi:hypothetical protein